MWILDSDGETPKSEVCTCDKHRAEFDLHLKNFDASPEGVRKRYLDKSILRAKKEAAVDGPRNQKKSQVRNQYKKARKATADNQRQALSNNKKPRL